ncbi:uncharacterized protein CLUP02_11973 [Colletotrichum lupini]|uniref:Uncharacterized protein n=1 Tax=Colletotrichum lupini TaxID=145971 RepID=A0A9Q8SZP5_9PEZI|nr:uncharacterized protein CLUP02_11973 [Colletotrichum lupini]UQC86472.1 hypothetical protein CLUP02_11973 [Colletotrichum lupini]
MLLSTHAVAKLTDQTTLGLDDSRESNVSLSLRDCVMVDPCSWKPGAAPKTWRHGLFAPKNRNFEGTSDLGVLGQELCKLRLSRLTNGATPLNALDSGKQTSAACRDVIITTRRTEELAAKVTQPLTRAFGYLCYIGTACLRTTALGFTEAALYQGQHPTNPYEPTFTATHRLARAPLVWIMDGCSRIDSDFKSQSMLNTSLTGCTEYGVCCAWKPSLFCSLSGLQIVNGKPKSKSGSSQSLADAPHTASNLSTAMGTLIQTTYLVSSIPPSYSIGYGMGRGFSMTDVSGVGSHRSQSPLGFDFRIAKRSPDYEDTSIEILILQQRFRANRRKGLKKEGGFCDLMVRITGPREGSSNANQRASVSSRRLRMAVSTLLDPVLQITKSHTAPPVHLSAGGGLEHRARYHKEKPGRDWTPKKGGGVRQDRSMTSPLASSVKGSMLQGPTTNLDDRPNGAPRLNKPNGRRASTPQPSANAAPASLGWPICGTHILFLDNQEILTNRANEGSISEGSINHATSGVALNVVLVLSLRRASNLIPPRPVTCRHGESNDDDDESMAQGLSREFSWLVGPNGPWFMVNQRAMTALAKRTSFERETLRRRQVTAGLSVPKEGPPSPALPLLYPASLIEAPAISVRHYRGAPRGGTRPTPLRTIQRPRLHTTYHRHWQCRHHNLPSSGRQCEYPPVGRIKATTYIHDLPLPGAVQRRHRDNLSLLSPSSSLASHTCAFWSNLFGTCHRDPAFCLQTTGFPSNGICPTGSRVAVSCYIPLMPAAVGHQHAAAVAATSVGRCHASSSKKVYEFFFPRLQQPSLMLCNLETALCQKDPQRPLSPAPAAAAAHLRFT